MLTKVFSVALAFFLTMPFFVFAQTPPTDEQTASFRPPSLATADVPAPPGTVDCFASYSFGSVPVDVGPSVTETVPGIPVTFSGTITNENSYPIIGGSVYAKVFRKQIDDSLAHQNGHFLVDQFVVKDSIVLKEKGEQDITFDWNIPRTAPSGEYEIALFFYTANRFNLLGLTFTDDVVGNKAQFTVQSDQTGFVAFDKNAVTLNNTEYRFAAFPPHFKKDETVKAEVKLQNTTDQEQTIALSWKLYNWDSLRAENLIQEKKETLTLKANETKSLSYETKDYQGAVSFLVVEASMNQEKSLLDIRFVRDDVSETRINFPSISSFPIKKGEANSVFACAHATNLPIVENGEINLTLTNTDNTPIHSYTYTGGITGAMMGVKDTFIPKENADVFTLTTTLKKDGKVVEKLSLNYDCKRIDPNTCQSKSKAITKASDSVGGKGALMAILVAGLAALTLLFRKLWQMRKNRIQTYLFLFGFLSVGMMGMAGTVEAAVTKSVVTTKNFPSLGYHWAVSPVTDSVPLRTTPDPDECDDGFRGSVSCGWSLGLSSGTATVTYTATLKNAITGATISDGASVPVGTQIKLVSKVYADTDISWVGTGYSGDSPAGHFVANAGPLSQACLREDFVNRYVQVIDLRSSGGSRTERSYDVYVLLNVHPPVSILSSGNANLSCDNTGVCTVTRAGAVTVNRTFPITQGKFYYRYYYEDNILSRSGDFTGCHANNVIMRKMVSNIRALSDPPIDPLYEPGNDPYCKGINCLPGPAYSASFPAKTITFNLTAVVPNAAPLTPTLTVDETSKPVNTNFTFTARTTDPDGDTLTYGFDFNNDSNADIWVPGAVSYVASGTARTTTYLWPTAGTRPVKVIAKDRNGNYSPWSLPVSVTSVAPPTLTFTRNPISLPAIGGNSTLTWTPTNATSCWAWSDRDNNDGGWTTNDGVPNGNWKLSTNGAKNQIVNLTTTTTFNIECWNSVDVSSGQKTVTVTVSAPTPVTTFTGTYGPQVNQTTISLPFGGAAINLNWSVTNAAGGSCTGYSTTGIDGWATPVVGGTGGKPVTGVNIPVTVSTTTRFDLDCWNAVGLPAVRKSITVNVAVDPLVLQLCLNGGVFAVGGETKSITLTLNDTRDLTTYFDSVLGCSGTDVTPITNYTDTPSTVVTVTPFGSNPNVITGNDVPGASDPGQQSATETVIVTYSGQTITLNVTVLEPACTPLTCADFRSETDQYCPGERRDFGDDSCGGQVTNCNGTKVCDDNFNWIEVAP